MDISVIIPTYNRADLIKFTLDSLQRAFHKMISLEIIVVDDGSTDNVVEVVSKNYPHIILLKNNGKGAPSARNTGLNIAKGEYILYLDSDDLIGEGFFKNKIEALEQDKSLDACYGEYDFFASDTEFDDSKITFKHKYPLIESADQGMAHLIHNLKGNFIPPNAIIWRKSFLQRIKGHDVSLLINQDVELLIRAIFNGLRIIGIKDNTKVYIRSHSLDGRVGNANTSIPKLRNILALRRSIYGDLDKYQMKAPETLKALSNYLFNFWRSTRHFNKEIAEEFLQLAKEVYWPIEIKGNIVFRTLAKILGPVKAVEAKYFLLKRD